MLLIYEMPTRGYKERTKVTYACDLKDFASVIEIHKKMMICWKYSEIKTECHIL